MSRLLAVPTVLLLSAACSHSGNPNQAIGPVAIGVSQSRRIREPERVVVIQGNLSIEEVHEQIIEVISERLLLWSE